MIVVPPLRLSPLDRKSTRLNSSHLYISYAVFCLKKEEYTFERRKWWKLTVVGDVRVYVSNNSDNLDKLSWAFSHFLDPYGTAETPFFFNRTGPPRDSSFPRRPLFPS